MSILDRIVASTKERVQRDKKAGLPAVILKQRPPFLFEQSLLEQSRLEQRERRPDMAFICEIKKASPSKGVIATDFPYLDIARAYEAAGADAISVLTEPEFFQGSPNYLAEIHEIVDIPLLRKDFIVDPFQIAQSVLLGADAILLICAILSPGQLAEYIRLADRLNLSCLVEAHDEDELRTALKAGARVVGVNNRNLHTFAVDPGHSIRLRKIVPPEIVFVAESGIRTAEDVNILRRHGVNAVLVGETLMRSPDKKAALAALKGGGLREAAKVTIAAGGGNCGGQ